MNKRFLFIIGAVLLSATALQAITNDERMAAWRANRFGMFIHWGAYAQAQGVFDGVSVDTGWIGAAYRTVATSEWFMQWKWQDFLLKLYPNTRDDDKQTLYDTKYAEARTYYKTNYANNFTGSSFNASSIVSYAKAAGMKYIVVTAKHHEGFAMYKTLKSADNNGTYYSFFAKNSRDPVGLLKTACADSGLMFGIYYSIKDWYHPAFRNSGNLYGWDALDTIAMRRYLDYMKGQLSELVTQYNPAILWFDGDWPGWCGEIEKTEIRNHIMSKSPDIIINDRCGKLGHYSTPEQALSPKPQEYDWEACMTMNDSWGFKKYDNNWKSAGTLIRMLVTAASRGGNFLLNIGPDQNGAIPSQSITILNAFKSWMAKYKDAIHGTTGASSGYCPDNVRLTQKGKKLYINILNGTSSDEFGNSATYSWPTTITLGKVTNPKPRYNALGQLVGYQVYMLNAPTTYLKTSFSGNKMTITLPSTAPDAYCAVLVVECTGTPAFQIPAVSTSGTALTIEAEDYVAKNPQVAGLVTETCGEGGYNIGSIYVNAWLDYNVQIPADGVYEVTYRVASPNTTGRIDFMTDGATHTSTIIPNTGGWQTYQDKVESIIGLTKGLHRIRLHASGPFFNLNYFKIKYRYSATSCIAPGKNEAEKYFYMKELTKYSSANASGGYFMGDAHVGDSIVYELSTRCAGQYCGEFRVAAPYSDGVSKAYFDVKFRDPSGSSMKWINKSRVHVPNTGGWENFMTVRTESFFLPRGYGLLSFKVGGEWGHYNMDWFRLARVLPDLSGGDIPIQAAAYDAQSGCTQYRVVDASGAYTGDYCMGNIDKGDWCEYKVFSPYTAKYRLRVYLASPDNNVGNLDVYVNGVYKGSVAVPTTGSWYEFSEKYIDITLYKNSSIIRLVSNSDPVKHFNIRSLRINQTE